MKKVLYVYTALEDEQVNDYLKEFKEQNPDITVNVTRESTGVITSKLLAEKDNPVADVVWGLSATSLLVLKQEGMLEAYAPEGVENILPQFKDDAEVPSWVGIDAWETAWVVNKEVLKPKVSILCRHLIRIFSIRNMQDLSLCRIRHLQEQVF